MSLDRIAAALEKIANRNEPDPRDLTQEKLGWAGPQTCPYCLTPNVPLVLRANDVFGCACCIGEHLRLNKSIKIMIMAADRPE